MTIVVADDAYRFCLLMQQEWRLLTDHAIKLDFGKYVARSIKSTPLVALLLNLFLHEQVDIKTIPPLKHCPPLQSHLCRFIQSLLFKLPDGIGCRYCPDQANQPRKCRRTLRSAGDR